METLASIIARTSFAISMEESRFTLNGALPLMRPDGLTIVATDGHRLAFVQANSTQSGNVDQDLRWSWRLLESKFRAIKVAVLGWDGNLLFGVIFRIA